MVVDEFVEDAVDGAGSDADEVGEFGRGEAASSCFLAGVVETGDDAEADAGFLGEVEELFVDRPSFFVLGILHGFGHGKPGGDVRGHEEGLIPALGGGMLHGFHCPVEGFINAVPVSYAGRDGGSGAAGDVFDEGELFELVGLAFQEGAGGEDHIIPGGLGDTGTMDGAGELHDLSGYVQMADGELVGIASRQGFSIEICVDGDDSCFALLTAPEFVGEKEALHAATDIIEGGAEDIGWYAFGFQDFFYFVEYGDAEIHSPFFVKFFHL